VPLLGIAGALALAVSARRRAPRPPDPSRCAWEIPDPITPNVRRRADELQALGAPLGTEYVEALDGHLYKFRREMHGPNKQNPAPHPGVGVRVCVLNGGTG
jgi:hypothetical protein